MSMAGRLAPWRQPSAALAIWSHKLLRWTTPMLVGLAAAGAVWLVLGGQVIFVLPLVAGAAVLVLAAVGLAVQRQGGRPPRYLSLPLAIVVVNAAFLVGWSNVLLGRKIESWHRAEWSTSR
jgi:hypothetical protein